MGEPRGEHAASLGARLRDLRAAHSLSLRQLAKRIGASPSLLSQIENGKVTPSVDTLYLLARALEVPVASFFADGPAGEAPALGGAEVVRRGDRARIELEGGVRWENLLPREERSLRFMEIHYAPGADSGEAMLRHPGRDLFLVLEGELTFIVGFGEHRLAAGDSITFGDFQPHRLRNVGDVPARAIVCVIGDREGGARPPGGDTT
jgi:transcriptional regulator with XRE-family HTH domain